MMRLFLLLLVILSAPAQPAKAQEWTFVGPAEHPVSALQTLDDGSILVSSDVLYRSTEHGLTWQRLEFTRPLSQIEEGPSGYLIGRSFSTVFVSEDGGTSWDEVARGGGLVITGVAIGADSTLYYGLQVSEFCRISTGCLVTGGGLRASYDMGRTWSVIGFEKQWAGWPVKTDQGQLYVSSGNMLAWSDDEGATWSQEAVVEGFSINHLVSDRRGSVLVATPKGLYTRERSSGQVVRFGRLYSRVSKLYVSPSGVLYALDTAVLRSADGGQTWQKMNVPEGCRSYCLFTETLDGHLLVGTPRGVYRSTSAVASSVDHGNGVANTSAVSMTVRSNPIHNGTFVDLQASTTQAVRLDVFDLLGRRVAQLHDGLIGAGVHQIWFDTSRLASGTYLSRLVTANAVHSALMVVVE